MAEIPEFSLPEDYSEWVEEVRRDFFIEQGVDLATTNIDELYYWDGDHWEGPFETIMDTITFAILTPQAHRFWIREIGVPEVITVYDLNHTLHLAEQLVAAGHFAELNAQGNKIKPE